MTKQLAYYTALRNSLTTTVKSLLALEGNLTMATLNETLTAAHAEIGLAGEALWVLVYLDYTIMWGYHRDGQLIMSSSFDPAYIQELRMFGTDGEVYLWRVGTSYNVRLRKDKTEIPAFKGFETTDQKQGFGATSVGSEPKAMDEWQILWGTDAQVQPAHWTVVQESRGARFSVPHTIDKPQLPLRLLVRHYLEYDSDGRCLISDMRMVELRDAALHPMEFVGHTQVSKGG